MSSFDVGVTLIADGDANRCIAISVLVGRLGLQSQAMGTGAEVLAAAAVRCPALVVLAVELRDPTGYEVCRELREQFGEGLPIVFVAGATSEPRDEIAVLLLGADDYFADPLPSDQFVARVRRLVARSSAASSRPSPLTRREHEVLGLLTDGRRSPEIAAQLCISKKTASTHIEHILRKLGAHSQAEAVAIGLRAGLVGRAPERGDVLALRPAPSSSAPASGRWPGTRAGSRAAGAAG